MTGPDSASAGTDAPSLETRLGSLTLRNPILTASGTYGLGYEFAKLADLSQIGGVVTKTVTMKERIGNPPPRTMESAGGMLNSIGLQNIIRCSIGSGKGQDIVTAEGICGANSDSSNLNL